ncbi:hypothetical protein R3P38DRAFT_2559417 [Favolaschia claudopus]|uniref:Alpha-type protein kinase domain-containing protein n=1 Tax=Favolaschia claudopus TaxID=2862362 RepID=A0AAW0A678_9AGAR
MTVLCTGCGQSFKYLDSARSNCHKCEKFDKCQGNETEMSAVEKLKQCSECGLVFPRLASSPCGQCKLRNAKRKSTCILSAQHTYDRYLATKPSNDKENLATKTADIQQSHSVISIESDDGDDIQEVGPSDMAEVKIKFAQNKRLSSNLRLTPKVKEKASGSSGRTAKFLHMRETARKRTDSSKTTQILFRVTCFLQKATGQKVGTRVPAQSRSFSLDDTMEHVFRTVVNTFQEPEGRWVQNYPGKSFKRENVYFTFANETDIPSNYTGNSTAAIANFTAEITTYVPIELTLDVPSESDDDDDEFDEIYTGRKRRKGRGKGRAVKKLKVKQEVSDDDFPARVKSEPTELGLPKARVSGSGTQVAPKFRLKSPVTFTKEHLSNSLDRPQEPQLFHGVRDIVAKNTPSLKTHFQLSCGDDHYLARRLENDRFRFNSSLELDAARAELLRGKRLKDLLENLIDEHGMLNPSLAECSTPELFIATITDREVVLGHLVCQPIPAIPFHKVVQPELDLLNAISHFSLVQNKDSMLFTKFKVASSDGSTSIFAPVTHSSSGDSGVDDGGQKAIDDFRGEHTCNDFCRNFGLVAY